MRNLKKDPIRLGILGAGSFAKKRLLPALKEISTIKAICLQKRDVLTVSHLAQEFQVPSSVTTREELLNCPGIEAIYIATQNAMHEQDAIACAKARLPTLCEKPLAPTVEAAGRMIKAFEATKTPLFVGQSLRFKPCVQLAQEMVRQDRLGTLVTMRAHFSIAVPKDNWRYQKKLGGGCLQDIGVHLIDLFRFLSGREILSVQAISQASQQVDETVIGLCTLEDNLLASFECSIGVDAVNGFELVGTKGQLISKASLRQTSEPIETLHLVQDGLKTALPVIASNIYVNELTHFAEILNGTASSIIDATEGLKNQKVIEALYRSLETHQEVKIP
jgi:predicted dehydrogenase